MASWMNFIARALAGPRRFMIIWVLTLVGVGLLWLLARSIGEPVGYLWYFFLGLYVVDSILFLAVGSANATIRLASLVLIISLEIVMAIYYLLIIIPRPLL